MMSFDPDNHLTEVNVALGRAVLLVFQDRSLHAFSWLVQCHLQAFSKLRL